jgi:hypothetical protein
VNHTATLLASGEVLIAGGQRPVTPTSGSAWTPNLGATHLFDPATGTPLAGGPPLLTPRAYHGAVRLPSGKVFIAGGEPRTSVFGDPGLHATDATELYDPRTGTFTPGPRLGEPRAGPLVALFSVGGRTKVLVAGGYAWPSGSIAALATTDIYDPDTNTITRGAPLPEARHGGAAVMLANGQVAIVGGTASHPLSFPARLATASFIYDGASGHFTTVQATPGREGFAALGSDVYATGGYDGSRVLASIERFDGARWSAVGSLSMPRSSHAVASVDLVGTGTGLLVTGGFTPGPNSTSRVLAETEIVWPSGQVGAAPPLVEARAYHTATSLPSGSVVIVGGTSGGSTLRSTIEVLR